MTKSGGSPKPLWFLSAVTSHDQSQLRVQERRDPALAALCTVGLLSALVISLFLRLLLPAALSLFPQLPPSYGAGRATGSIMSEKGTCTSLPLRARKQQCLSPSIPPLEWFTGSRGPSSTPQVPGPCSRPQVLCFVHEGRTASMGVRLRGNKDPLCTAPLASSMDRG